MDDFARKYGKRLETPADVLALLEATPPEEVYSTLIRDMCNHGGTADIVLTLTGADTAPPLWQQWEQGGCEELPFVVSFEDQLKTCLSCPDRCGNFATIRKHIIKLIEGGFASPRRAFTVFYAGWLYAGIRRWASALRVGKAVSALGNWLCEILALLKYFRRRVFSDQRTIL